MRAGWRRAPRSSSSARARASRFVVVWLAAQAALIATGDLRPEHAFAFRMFSESTTAVLHLQRRTFDGELCLRKGAGGRAARRALYLSMRDYIDAPELSLFDARMPAAYGRAAELARLRAALDYVLGRLGDDDRTTAQFVVDVALRSGAGAESRVTVESRARRLDAR